MTFKSIDDIHSCDSLSLGVLCVCDGITDNILKENFENTASLFVDQSRNTFDTTSASKTTDSWLGDSLDVITQDFAMTLGASLSESFPPLPRPDMISFFVLLYEQYLKTFRDKISLPLQCADWETQECDGMRFPPMRTLPCGFHQWHEIKTFSVCLQT